MKITDIAQNGQEKFTLSDPSMPYKKIADLTSVTPEGQPKNDSAVEYEINVEQSQQTPSQMLILQLISKLIDLL